MCCKKKFPCWATVLIIIGAIAAIAAVVALIQKNMADNECDCYLEDDFSFEDDAFSSNATFTVAENNENEAVPSADDKDFQ